MGIMEKNMGISVMGYMGLRVKGLGFMVFQMVVTACCKQVFAKFEDLQEKTRYYVHYYEQ